MTNNTLRLENIENRLKKLETQNIEKKWTETFIKQCKYENFNFDEVLLYMGGPLWESETLKEQLLGLNHGIITQSLDRYIISTGQ